MLKELYHGIEIAKTEKKRGWYQTLTKPKKQGSKKPAIFTILEVLRHVKATYNCHTWSLFAVNSCDNCECWALKCLSTSRMVNLAGLCDLCFFGFVSIW